MKTYYIDVYHVSDVDSIETYKATATSEAEAIANVYAEQHLSKGYHVATVYELQPTPKKRKLRMTVHQDRISFGF